MRVLNPWPQGSKGGACFGITLEELINLCEPIAVSLQPVRSEVCVRI